MEEAIRGLFAYRPIFLYMYGYGATHEREHYNMIKHYKSKF